jgi:hypothetical protein
LILNNSNYLLSLLVIFLFPFTLRVVNHDSSMREKSFVTGNISIQKYSKSNKKNSLYTLSKLPISNNSIQLINREAEVIDFIGLKNNNYNTGFVKPVRGCVNSRFGNRNGGNHCGIDLQLRTGDTVYASKKGIVRYAKYHKGGYGNLIVITHENDVETYYAHLSKFLVSTETEVKLGQAIGLGGNTGKSSGPHLHFETRVSGIPVNPEQFLYFGGRNRVRKIPHVSKVVDENLIIDAVPITVPNNMMRKVRLIGNSISKSTGFLAILKYEGDSLAEQEIPRILAININETYSRGALLLSNSVIKNRIGSSVPIQISFQREGSKKVEIIKASLKVIN